MPDIVDTRVHLPGIAVASAAVMPASRRSAPRIVLSAVAVLVACIPAYEVVHVESAAPVPAPWTASEVLDDGTSVEVVAYVQPYDRPVTSYPSVVWSGRVYYNVGGSFVHYDPICQCWVYYPVAPPPLVLVWNHAYPAWPFVWTHGHAGPGWYWGHHHHHPWPYSPPPLVPPPPRPPRPMNPPSHGGPGPHTGTPAAPGGPRPTNEPRLPPFGPRPHRSP